MTMRIFPCSFTLAAVLTLSQDVLAQGPGGPRPRAVPPSAEQAAPIDLTGYWVSVVTEDWRWRMLTAPHGDYASVPLNPAGKKIADTFDPSKYGPGEIDCRAYGAGGLMRMPTRVHISWEDPNTLKLESDWGQQTRELHFVPAGPPEGGGGPVAAGPSTPQGTSVASWELPYNVNANANQPGPRGGAVGFAAAAPAPLPGGDLRLVTSNLAPGWLRRNGVPYGSRARMTEYFQTFTDPTGKRWFDVTTDLEDPEYLNAPFITSDDFRSEPDASKWAPHACKDLND